MLRSELKDALNAAMKEKETRAVSTIRLILAAAKDRDIAARSKGERDGISDKELLELLQSMVKQRQESAELYEKGGRPELSAEERQEIEIIRRFLPKPMDKDETDTAIAQIIDELDASSLKDMGRIMSGLRERYPGRMDFAKAGALVKERLG